MLNTYKKFEAFFEGYHNMSYEELNKKIREGDAVFGSMKFNGPESFKARILMSDIEREVDEKYKLILKKNTQDKLIEKLEDLIENSTFEVLYKFYKEN